MHKILVVDDEVSYRELLKQGNLGYSLQLMRRHIRKSPIRIHFFA